MASDGAQAGGFSLSLGPAKKPTARRTTDQGGGRAGPVREEVLGFGTDGGLQTAAGPAAKQGPLVIAAQANSYKTGAKYVPTFVPEVGEKIDANGINNFETAQHDTAVAQQDVTYGLLLRGRPEPGSAGDGRQQQEAQPPAQPGDRDAAKLKEDLEALPPEADLDAYAAMPVDQFGMALLRGMGWSEGQSIGRTTKEEVKAKELVRRPQRLGLGAAPAPEQVQKKYIKPGESREQRDLVYVDAQGVQRGSKPVDEALVDRQQKGVLPGKVMRVVEGRHSGLLCEVVSLEAKQEGRSDRARVRLLPSYESVTVRCKELGEKNEMEERRQPSSNDRGGSGRDGGRSSGRERGSEKHRGSSKSSKSGKRQRSASPLREPERRPWLVANIRVKIVDKSVEGGRLYLKKGTVVDVKTPTVCDVFVDGLKESILDLHQRQLETVVPAAEGTPVMVLAGPLRGKQGKLLQRNTESGLAAVQLGSDFSVHKVGLDDVSEYTGPQDGWE
ncbi:hypothetical protein ACK3TF_003714 [Chlorella vulgaris]